MAFNFPTHTGLSNWIQRQTSAIRSLSKVIIYKPVNYRRQTGGKSDIGTEQYDRSGIQLQHSIVCGDDDDDACAVLCEDIIYIYVTI